MNKFILILSLVLIYNTSTFAQYKITNTETAIIQARVLIIDSIRADSAFLARYWSFLKEKEYYLLLEGVDKSFGCDKRFVVRTDKVKGLEEGRVYLFTLKIEHYEMKSFDEITTNRAKLEFLPVGECFNYRLKERKELKYRVLKWK